MRQQELETVALRSSVDPTPTQHRLDASLELWVPGGAAELWIATRKREVIHTPPTMQPIGISCLRQMCVCKKYPPTNIMRLSARLRQSQDEIGFIFVDCWGTLSNIMVHTPNDEANKTQNTSWHRPIRYVLPSTMVNGLPWSNDRPIHWAVNIFVGATYDCARVCTIQASLVNNHS